MIRTIISFKDVNKTFYSYHSVTPVLKKISFSIKENEIVALLGPSGAGKTTIFNIISGLEKPDEGTIEKNASLGYMFQKDNLFEWLTIRKNIELGLKIQHILTHEKKKEIEEQAKLYGLYDFLDFKPSELSGGMRQRVALLRTLVLKPDLLLLDEPFSALDYITRLNLEEEVYNIIKKLKISSMIVTHDISEAIAFSDRIYVLSSRPATIKKEYDLKILFSSANNSPSAKRKNDKFKDLFAQIVEDLK